VAGVLLRDDPWTRLPLLVPLALVLSLLALMGFLRLLTPPPPKLAPAPLSVELVEVPASPAVAPPPEPAPALPPPEAAPEPPPESAVEPPPEPLPEPVKTAPPPEPQVRRRPVAPKPAPQPAAAPPVQPTAPPTPAAPPAAGGLTGARAIFKPLPEVPESLRHRNVELVATARFQVAANGSADVELIQPTSDPELNRSLLETLRKWRFFPATEQGRAVASIIDIRIPVTVR
jgi:protein TonB